MDERLRYRKYAPFRIEYFEAGLELTTKQRMEFYDAVIFYHFGSEAPEFKSRAQRSAWASIKRNLDDYKQKYLNGCKGKEHGKKGGAPKGNQNARKNNPENNPENNPLKNKKINIKEEKGNNKEKKKENNNSLSLSIEQNHDYSFLSSLIFGDIDKNQSIIDAIEARTEADRITIQERINIFLREKSLGLQDPKWLCETQEQFVQLCINVVSYQLSKGYG